MERNLRPHEVDVQAAQVLEGLRQLTRLTHFASLQDQVRPLINELADLKVPSPASGTREVTPEIEVEKNEIITFVSSRLRDDTQNLTGRLSTRLSGTVAEARRQYEQDITTARRRRQWRYLAIIAGSVLLAFLGYLSYAFLNRDVPQDIANAIIWNLVASVISGAAGASLAKWRDDLAR